MNNSSTKDREITLERTFDAPRDVVFDAFTNPKHVDHWWGPIGFSTTTSKMDVREGGEWLYIMRHAEYGEFKNRIRYRSVSRPQRLQYLHDSGIDNDPAARQDPGDHALGVPDRGGTGTRQRFRRRAGRRTDASALERLPEEVAAFDLAAPGGEISFTSCVVPWVSRRPSSSRRAWARGLPSL
jgi:uncharacterized protein YndB with AHSA1/START domain